MSINKVEVDGNLSRDPEVNLSQGGAAYWTGTLAHTEVRWDKDRKADMPKVNWIRLIAFGDVATRLDHEALTKGDALLITGSLSTSTVEKDTGTKETKTSVEVKAYSVLRRSRYTRPTPAPAEDDPWGAPGGSR